METGVLDGGVMLFGLATVLVGIGALVGWWVRERYEYGRYRSYRSDMRPQSDDLSSAMHLLEELLRLQRGTTAQLHDVQSRIEFLSHAVAESQRTLGAQITEASKIASVERLRSDELSSFSLVERRADYARPAAASDWSGLTDRRLNPVVPGEKPNVMARQDTAPEDAASFLESAAAAFLSSADSKEFDNAAVATFFAERGVTASFVLESENRWAMIAVHRASNDRRAVGIPAIRVGMRQIDLQPYFDFVSYNGVDPIRSSQVVRLASLARDSGKWTTTQKGIIDGSR